MNFEKLEERHESLINEYLEIFGEWSDIDIANITDNYTGDEMILYKEQLYEKLFDIKNELDIIGAGMQLYQISEEIKRQKSGIILP